MNSRRARGDGGLHWDERRQRWIASVTVGYDGRGKRVVKRASGRTKTEARDKLRALVRDQADGFAIGGRGATVASLSGIGWRSGWSTAARRQWS